MLLNRTLSLKKSNFQVNHGKRINNILQSLKSAGSLINKQYKKIKVVGSRPNVLYGLCKVHKATVDICQPFISILCATGTLTYKNAKLLPPILSYLTINELTVKNLFSFRK